MVARLEPILARTACDLSRFDLTHPGRQSRTFMQIHSTKEKYPLFSAWGRHRRPRDGIDFRPFNTFARAIAMAAVLTLASFIFQHLSCLVHRAPGCWGRWHLTASRNNYVGCSVPEQSAPGELFQGTPSAIKYATLCQS